MLLVSLHSMLLEFFTFLWFYVFRISGIFWSHHRSDYSNIAWTIDLSMMSALCDWCFPYIILMLWLIYELFLAEKSVRSFWCIDEFMRNDKELCCEEISGGLYMLKWTGLLVFVFFQTYLFCLYDFETLYFSWENYSEKQKYECQLFFFCFYGSYAKWDQKSISIYRHNIIFL